MPIRFCRRQEDTINARGTLLAHWSGEIQEGDAIVFEPDQQFIADSPPIAAYSLTIATVGNAQRGQATLLRPHLGDKHQILSLHDPELCREEPGICPVPMQLEFRWSTPEGLRGVYDFTAEVVLDRRPRCHHMMLNARTQAPDLPNRDLDVGPWVTVSWWCAYREVDHLADRLLSRVKSEVEAAS